jgi:cytochrome c peroxidase
MGEVRLDANKIGIFPRYAPRSPTLACRSIPADVAAHFSALTKGALDSGTIALGDPDIIGFVERGVSARGLLACASCHGAHAGGPIETPTLA